MLTHFLLDSDVEDVVKDIPEGTPQASVRSFDEWMSEATVGGNTKMAINLPSKPRMPPPTVFSQLVSSGRSTSMRNRSVTRAKHEEALVPQPSVSKRRKKRKLFHFCTFVPFGWSCI